MTTVHRDWRDAQGIDLSRPPDLPNAELVRAAWLAATFRPGWRLRIALYLRVSTPGQANNTFSLEDQLKDLHTLLRRRGLDPDDATRCEISVFTDVQTSVTDDLEDRRVLRLLRQRIRADEFDLFLCFDPDRHARKGEALVLLVGEALHHGCYVAYVTKPELVVTDGQGGIELTCKALLFFEGWRGESEHKQFKVRTTREKAHKLAEGCWAGYGPDAFAVKRVYGARVGKPGRQVTIDAEPDTRRHKWETVVRCFDAALAGRGPTEIGQDLDRDGVPTPNGEGRWNHDRVYRILVNPVYKGWALTGRPKGTRRARNAAAHVMRLGTAPRANPEGSVDTRPRRAPAWIPEWQFDGVQAILADRENKGGGVAAADRDPRFLLRGRLACGHCGQPLSTETQKRAGGTADSTVYRAYQCPRSNNSKAVRAGAPRCVGRLPALHAEAAEWQAWEAAERLLLDADAWAEGIAALRSGGRSDARARLESDLAERERQWADEQRAYKATQALVKAAQMAGNERRAASYEEDLQAHERQLGHLEEGIAHLRREIAAASAQEVSGADLAALRERVVKALGRMRAAAGREGAAGPATPADVRWLIELLDIRGVVRADGDGARRLPIPGRGAGKGPKLARWRTGRAFAIEWTWHGLPIPAETADRGDAGGSTRGLVKLRVVPTTSGYSLVAAAPAAIPLPAAAARA